MNKLILSFAAKCLLLCLNNFSILVPPASFWMLTCNTSRTKVFVDFLVHFLHIKVITPICSFAVKFDSFLALIIWLFHSNFFPISLTQFDATIKSIAMAVFLFPFLQFFSTDLPLMRELASSNPWAVVTGVLISASFLISSTRYGSMSSMGVLCPAWPLFLPLFTLCLTVWVVIIIESGTEYFFLAKDIISLS
jgi:hypothetical protein